MQVLADETKEKSTLLKSSATKEKLTRFFDLLEEVMERHKFAKVMEDDEDGRELIGEEVVKLVIPSLQRFSQKHRENKSVYSLLCNSLRVDILTIFVLKIHRSVRCL